MKRRAFLGFLGGAAAAGPMAVKSAAEMTVTDLNLARSGIMNAATSLGGAASASNNYDQVVWAKEALKRISGVSNIEKAMRKQRFYGNSELDANVASLRSISLVNRIRISRDIQFERSEEREKSYLEGIIAGLWS